ncbi:MAG: biotin-dependent carboxyltransferase family protein [Gemmatimonadales bacterium]
MITVLRAPPFATVQDRGWSTGRSIGLPPGGAMDPELLTIANLLVGNAPDAAALEWALGPGTLRLERGGRVAVTGQASVTLGGASLKPWTAVHAGAGSELTVVPLGDGRFVYVAIEGGIATPAIAGSRSTYIPAGLGGVAGRRLKNGDQLPTARPQGTGALGKVEAVARPMEPVLRVMRGPQADRFDPPVWDALLGTTWTVLAASDRMGYRLAGPAIAPRERATLPSEASCPGAVQVPDGGQPIVLMPDGPTVGGYPKLAVVARADLALLAQCPPGRPVRFREVTPGEARDALRQQTRRLERLERRVIPEGGAP